MGRRDTLGMTLMCLAIPPAPASDCHGDGSVLLEPRGSLLPARHFQGAAGGREFPPRGVSLPKGPMGMLCPDHGHGAGLGWAKGVAQCLLPARPRPPTVALELLGSGSGAIPTAGGWALPAPPGTRGAAGGCGSDASPFAASGVVLWATPQAAASPSACHPPLPPALFPAPCLPFPWLLTPAGTGRHFPHDVTGPDPPLCSPLHHQPRPQPNHIPTHPVPRAGAAEL